jgi:hypothetical protein
MTKRSINVEEILLCAHGNFQEDSNILEPSIIIIIINYYVIIINS